MQRTTRSVSICACSFLISATCVWRASSGEPPDPKISATRVDQYQAAPPAVEELNHSQDFFTLNNSLMLLSQSAYSIGDPTDEEQLYLELINRARILPASEALRLATSTDAGIQGAILFFSVDLSAMIEAISLFSPAPPLSFNQNLIATARSHSTDMFQNQFQGHTGTDGSTSSQRATRNGYIWNRIAENVYSTARSVEHGHAGFEIDWGNGPGGMQDPPGHRLTIHEPQHREIGIGVVIGKNGTVGPQVVTQNLGSRSGLSPFITGVSYIDFNANQFYDLGEGIGGLRVDLAGYTSHAISAASGGFSVPVPGNGSYVVTFTGPSLVATTRSVTVSGGNNVKLDLALPYIPPSISGLDTVPLNRLRVYMFTPVAGATGYRWKADRRIPLSVLSDLETGLVGIDAITSSGYSVRDSAVKASGSYSIHLAQPDGSDQFITFQKILSPSATSASLRFAARLGWASPNQRAIAQVSTDGGQNWSDVWSRSGTSTQGQTTFSSESVSLAPYVGREIRIRFGYARTGTSYFDQVISGVGFYLDDISVLNTVELANFKMGDADSGNQFGFTPTDPGEYSLAVSPRISGRILPWGPIKTVSALMIPDPLPPTIASIKKISAAELELTVRAATSDSLVLQRASNIKGPWTDTTNILLPASTVGSFRTIAGINSSPNFFRLVYY